MAGAARETAFLKASVRWSRRVSMPTLVALIHVLQTWRRRARERQDLRRYMRLEVSMRRDLGIYCGEAEREFSKPFWRA
jgi:uncharacterized protein YjiS (DUF1127 family)